MGTVQQWTGREAKALRQALRLTAAQFAESLGVSVRTIGNWEAKGAAVTPVPELQAVLDTALAQADSAAQQRFWSQIEPKAPRRISSSDQSADLAAETPQPAAGVLLPVLVNGRTVLVPVDASALAGSGLAALLGNVAVARSVGGGVDTETLPLNGLDEIDHVAHALADPEHDFDGSVVDYFRVQLEQAKAHDGAAGPQQALPRVLAVLDALSSRARDVPASIRPDLLILSADGAEFAGWLYRDLRDMTRATYWYDRAMEWAQEAGDTGLQGYVLLRKSQMAYDLRDATRTLGLARAAKHGPWALPAQVQVEVTLQMALGLAMCGESVEDVERSVGEAVELLDQPSPEDSAGQLGAWFTEDTLRLRSASCYTEAGKPAKAAELFATVLAGGELSHRDEGYFVARRAAALALSGEPDEAATLGVQAAGVASAVRSERTVRVLHDVARSLAPWRSRPRVAELRNTLV